MNEDKVVIECNDNAVYKLSDNVFVECHPTGWVVRHTYGEKHYTFMISDMSKAT